MESNYKTKRFYIQFCELGSYDRLEYWFDSYEEAENKLKELIEESPIHFSFISEIKLARRNEKKAVA